MSNAQPTLTPIPDSGGLYAHAVDLVVVLPLSGRTLTIKAGMRTDGMSLPPLLWTLMRLNPFDADFILPAVVHDALYEAELFDRASCDAEFQALLQINSVRSAEKAHTLYEGVRLGGHEWAWKDHTPESISEARKYCTLS